MGELVLLPKQDDPHPGPDDARWTLSTGSEAAPLLRDDNDSTYIETPVFFTSNSRQARAYFNPIPQSLPEGSRVRNMRVRVRARKITGNPRRVTVDLDRSLPNATAPGDIRADTGPGAWSHGNGTFTLTDEYQTFISAAATAWRDGTEVTQSKLNRIVFGLPSNAPGHGNQPSVRISELAMLVEYDERPNATAATSGTITNTSSPLLVWGYEDDFEPQVMYHVQVRDPVTSALVYSSGNVQSGEQWHQVADALPPGTYDWDVRVAQAWPDRPGSAFWSLSSNTQQFTVATISPASPSLIVTGQGHRAKLDVLTNLNLIDFTGAHVENGYAPLDGEFLDGITHDNINLSDSTSAAHTGTLGLVATFEAADPAFNFRGRMVRVDQNVEYRFSFWSKNVPGSPALDIEPVIIWRDDTSFLSSDVGTAVSQVDGEWTEIAMTATAPAGARWAAPGVQWSGGSASDAYYLDDFSLNRSAAASGFPAAVQHDDANRGGMFAYRQAYNVLTDADSSILSNHAWSPSSLAGSEQEVGLSTDQAFHGDSSLKMFRNSGSAGILGADLGGESLIAIPEGATRVHGTYFLYADTSTASWSLVIQEFDSEGDFIGSVVNFSRSAVAGDWVWLQGSGDLSPEARKVKVIVQTASVTSSDGNFYMDQAQLAFDLDGSVQFILFDGSFEVDGPYTEVQYSEDDGETWRPFTTLEPQPSDGVFELFDHEVRKGLPRKYRARSFGTVTEDFFVSPWSTEVEVTDIDYRGVWLNVRGPLGTAPDSEHRFEFDGAAMKAESIDDGGSQIHFAGQRYAVAEWGEEQARSIKVHVQLPSEDDLLAFRELVRARKLLVYRDGRKRRGIGRIANPTINDEPGTAGWSADFDFNLNGKQIADDD